MLNANLIKYLGGVYYKSIKLLNNVSPIIKGLNHGIKY
jgi:hypothetical protein